MTPWLTCRGEGVGLWREGRGTAGAGYSDSMLAAAGARLGLPASERTADLAGAIPLLSVTHRVLRVELSVAIIVALRADHGHVCLGR